MDRRRKVWHELTAGVPDEPDGAAEATPEVIDGIVFTYDGEARCKVCGPATGTELPNAQEVRSAVDSKLVAGATYKRVLQDIGPLVEDWPPDRRPSYHSIRRHQLRHLGSDAGAVREIVERRALEQGLRIAVGDGPIVTRAAILELVRDRGFAALATGEISPTLAHTLYAAELLEEVDREAGSMVSAGQLAEQIRAFVEVVRAQVPEDTWDRIVRTMESGLGSATALPAPPSKGDEDHA